MLPDEELTALASDIEAHGLRHPVVLLDGQVLDGRNRQAACALAGVEPTYQEFDPDLHGPTPVAFVLSENVSRRHLTGSQRALAAARLASLGGARRRSANLPVELAGALRPTQAEAAGRLRVSERSVRHACEVLEKATPDVVAAVERGELAVSAAAQLARLSHVTQAVVLEAAIEKTRDQASKTINVRSLVKAAQRTNDAALSQWDTPDELARRMARLLGSGGWFKRRKQVLEPSAGHGALVQAVLEASGQGGRAAAIEAVEIDPKRCRALRKISGLSVHRGDYLKSDPVDRSWPLGPDGIISNPPFDKGVEIAHLAKMMDEARERIVVQLPIRSMHGEARCERVWSRVGREWWIRAEARLVVRPKYEDDGGRDEIVVVLLTREAGPCDLEWWDLREEANA